MMKMKALREATESEIEKLRTKLLKYEIDLSVLPNLSFCSFKNNKKKRRIMCSANSKGICFLTSNQELFLINDNEVLNANSMSKEEVQYFLNYNFCPTKYTDSYRAMLNNIFKNNELVLKNNSLKLLEIEYPSYFKLQLKMASIYGDINESVLLSLSRYYDESMLKDKIQKKLNESDFPSYKVLLNKKYAKLVRTEIKKYIKEHKEELKITAKKDKLDVFSKYNSLMIFLQAVKSADFVKNDIYVDATILNDNVIKCVFGTMIFKYDVEKKKMTCSNIKTIKNIISVINKNATMLTKIDNSYKIKSLNINLNKISVSSIIKYKDKDIKVLVDFEEKASFAKYKKAVNDKIEEQKMLEEQTRLNFINLIKQNGLYGNALVKDILTILDKNDWNISEGAIVKILRGKSGLDSRIHTADVFGVYELMTEDEILRIFRCMVKNNLIIEKEVKGSYGRFNVYTISDIGRMYFELEIEKVTKNAYSKYKDEHWHEFLLKDHSNDSNTESSKQLCLLDKKTAVCKNYDLVKKFVNTKPESWKEYAKTMYSLESAGLKKKYWKSIVNMFEN